MLTHKDRVFIYRIALMICMALWKWATQSDFNTANYHAKIEAYNEELMTGDPKL